METVLLKDALTVIHERKSVRHYTSAQVSKNDIEKILKAGMAAPAAMHMIPWRFIIISDKNILKKLSDELPFANMLLQAGTAIVVCVEPEEAAGSKESFAILDGACASENILLAAEALGLGAVWTAVYPNHGLMEMVRKELDIPASVIPLNVIPIGYPTGEDKAQDKYDRKLVRWEKW